MNLEQLLERYGPVALLCGADSMGIEEALSAIRAAFAEAPMAQMNMQRFYGDESKATQIFEACQSMPAFSTARLIEWHATSAASSAKILRGLASYLDDPNPSTLLVLVMHGKVDGRLSSVKKARKAGWIHEHLDYGPDGLRRWLQEQLSQRELKLEPEAAELLLEAVAGDRMLLRNELEKLALYAEGETLDAALIKRLTRSVLDEDVWQLADHLVGRRQGDALGLVEALEQEQVSGYQLVPALLYRFKVLAKVVDGQSRGLGGQQLAKAAGLRAWEVRRLTPLARQWSPDNIGRALAALARAESRLKGAWRAPDTRSLQARALQALCVEICAL